MIHMRESFVIGLDHVQLAMPRGEEARAEDFYCGVLGFEMLPKPSHLAARGGCWFRSGSVQVHLGVESDFTPARKAHPAFYAADPFGNRLEFMERIDV